MTTLRDIRKKIHSVDNIKKITQAMELVAASRLRKAQAKIEAATPYAIKLQELLARLLASAEECHHPLLETRKITKRGVVIIAGDRGLCGGYNQNVYNTAEKFLHKHETSQVGLILVGRKPIDYFKTKKWDIFFKIKEWGGKITYSQIKDLTKVLIDFYLERQLDEIWIVYAHFINMSAREIRIDKFLPLTLTTPSPSKDTYIFEPDPTMILTEMLPRYFTMKMQMALNEAYASELAARISSMRSATKNSEEMVKKLTLERNKVRQAGITNELIEITAGAESL